MSPRNDTEAADGLPPTQPDEDRALDQVLAGARVVAGVIASSLAEVEDTVSLPQLRVLVAAVDRGVLTLAAVAGVLGVHPSNATRLVERLVQAGLLDRRDDPDNRRQLQLSATDAGRDLVATVMDHRREAFRRLMQTLPPTTRTAVGAAMAAFAEAASTPTDTGTWVVPIGDSRSTARRAGPAGDG